MPFAPIPVPNADRSLVLHAPVPHTPGPVVLPRLLPEHQRVRHYDHDPVTLTLCASLLRSRVARPRDWQRCKRDPLALTERALRRWTRMNGGRTLKHWGFTSTLKHVFTPQQRSMVEDEDTDLCMIEVDTAVEGGFGGAAILNQFAIMGPILELMEAAAGPDIAATFYEAFTHGVGRWLPTFDRYDAEFTTEIREEQDEDDEAEIHEVSIPSCLHHTPIPEAQRQAAAQKIPDEFLRTLYLDTLALDQVACSAAPDAIDAYHDTYGDSGPIIPLIVCFERFDAIEAYAHDYYSDVMQSSHLPIARFFFHASNPSEVRSAFDRYGVFCRTVASAYSIMRRLPQRDGEEQIPF